MREAMFVSDADGRYRLVVIEPQYQEDGRQYAWSPVIGWLALAPGHGWTRVCALLGMDGQRCGRAYGHQGACGEPFHPPSP